MATRDTGAVGGHITRRLVQIADGALGNAKKTIQSIETMNIIRKRQVKLKNLSAPNNVELFQQLFSLMA
jgi:hypothetical protein